MGGGGSEEAEVVVVVGRCGRGALGLVVVEVGVEMVVVGGGGAVVAFVVAVEFGSSSGR